jgi:o-succinylbenzoate synthase
MMGTTTSRIEIEPYRLRLAVPYRWSKGSQHFRAGLILRAEVAGAVGWGEAALPPHVDYPGAAMAAECAALIAGLDPEAPGFLDEVTLRECPPRLRCGIATAVFSARAAAAGQPLSAWLLEQDAGTSAPLPDRVPVNDLINDADPAACAERAREAAARGQLTVKVKVTTERALDIERIAAVRAAVPEATIRIDPNESWPLAWAADQLQAMARYGIDYCEEPLPRGTPLAAYAELRRCTAVPIALDDTVRTLNDVDLIAALGAADGLILKAQRVGGPDRLLALLRRAAQHGLWCTITSSIESSIGLTLGIHCAALSAAVTGTAQPLRAAGIGTARLFAEHVGDPPPIVDGQMAVPRAPGLGIDAPAWWAGRQGRA